MTEYSMSSRRTSEVEDEERRVIRAYNIEVMPAAQIAEAHNLTKEQVHYIRTGEAAKAKPQKLEWNPRETEALYEAYERLGWQPVKITQELSRYKKTRAQVYRKMMREFRGR